MRNLLLCVIGLVLLLTACSTTSGGGGGGRRTCEQIYDDEIANGTPYHVALGNLTQCVLERDGAVSLANVSYP